VEEGDDAFDREPDAALEQERMAGEMLAQHHAAAELKQREL
jgi:hypothetical protein